MIYLLTGFGSFFLAIFLTWLVRRYALKRAVLDYPNQPRKVHLLPTPKLGGLAVFGAFLAVTGILAAAHTVVAQHIPFVNLLGIWLAGAVLMIGGYLDDRYDLAPALQVFFPIVAAAIAIGSGILVTKLTNPLGGYIPLTNFFIHGVPIIAAAFAFLWLLGMMYTVKFLDGLDGLASGITLIGTLTLFGLSFAPQVQQPYTAALAIAFAGALLGFLLFNWHPASIFLGEGGSTFLGFILGILAIISGGKIATALLVMGIPILDVAWVIVRRAFWERRSPFRGDRKHLHFRLLDIGLSHRQSVLCLYVIAASFGAVALTLQSFGKLLTLGVLVLIMVGGAVTVVLLYRRRIRQRILPF